MAREPKPTVTMDESFDLLDIRVGWVLSVEPEPSARKPSYKLTLDFGKFGQRTSVARLTQHPPEELLNKTVLAILNFPTRQVGEVSSECLVLGVQLPGCDSGDATPITTMKPVKLGSKLS